MNKDRPDGRRTVRRRERYKKLRAKIGPWPWIFLIAATLITGTYAIAVNRDLQDKLNAYHERKEQVEAQAKGRGDREAEVD